MAAAAATSGAQSSSSSSSSGSSNQGQEFIVRIPKQTKKRYHVMRFNAAHKQDISKWSQIRMERENNMKEFKMEDEMPKFGAGSEFGRDQKEEARRKKYGIIMKKYNPDDQPWLLRVGGKGGKKFKAIREGGVSENTSFYVFCKAPDGVFEAFPIEEWYNFNPVNRFKALTAEEAEVEFERRDKVMNHFSIMVRKKMALEEEGAKEEGEEEKGKKGKKGKKEKNRDFQITEMDDWVSDSDGDGDDDSDGDRDDDGDGGKKKKKGKAGEDDKKKKKKKNQSDEEALEESDEGDFDDREVDYMSASSSEEEEPEDEKANRELKGVEDEDALRAVDQSDEEEEGEKEEEKPENEEEAAKDEKSAEPKPKSKADKKEGGSSKSASKGNSSGESSSESSDSDFDDSKFQSAMFMQKPKKKNGCESANSSRANTPTKHVSDEKKSKGSSKSLKRKMMEESPSAAKTDGSAPKRPRSESNLPSTPSMPSSWSSSTEGITEESVRRYLLRKPMTTTELLQKFKSKRTGLSSEKLVNTIAQILKRLNPEKQTIKGKLYLSIKP
ncbi:general transcription factor IIF subunit 1 isoform X6 [Rhipicephalus sanguineus]|uniref:general transcription factor IIF subunit 1 isoform X6 n=1 Tax=Rhipicephalus sanguineus TaxID=34632 RepID=UPI001893835D|nr:general transcription factor IIF subunit 1 isoform X6 [Rhipicephalus sanguineus]